MKVGPQSIVELLRATPEQLGNDAQRYRLLLDNLSAAIRAAESISAPDTGDGKHVLMMLETTLQEAQHYAVVALWLARLRHLQ